MHKYFKTKNCPYKLKSSALLLLLLVLFTGVNSCRNDAGIIVSIITDTAPGKPAMHGIEMLTSSLVSKNIRFEKAGSLAEAKGSVIVVAGLANGRGLAAGLLNNSKKEVPQTAEALAIWKTSYQKKTVWVVSGYDDNGLMYGLSDIAERISWKTGSGSPLSELREITDKPDIKERAVSIYTMNRRYWESRFYDEDYWKRYFDLLAKNRFNGIVLIFGYENGGFLAPCYPYFFDVDGFPAVKMDGMTSVQQETNLKALNSLIKMAHERGIHFSVGIWDHIYRGGVQAGGVKEWEDPRDHFPWMVNGLTSENLISYTKDALDKFIKVVPEIDGIQFRMHNESGLKREEVDSFWPDVFVKMKETAPNLRVDLRAKELPESVIQSAVDIGINFRITTKFWMEQMGLPFHPTHINRENQFEIRHSYSDFLNYPQRYKMVWRLWNGGTARILLWGSPDYVKRFAQNAHLYDGDSYEVNEPLATKMEAQPHDAEPFKLLKPEYQYYDYEFERYWHFFQVFGRVGYNPDTSPEVWEKEFELRFGKKAGPVLEEALHKASWILPRIVASCYPYGCFPTTRGWPEKQRLGDLPEYAVAEGSDIEQFASFDTEAQMLIEGGETAKILPSMTSLWLEETSNDINKLIARAEKIAGNSRNKEFSSTITDLKILSNLALFHSRRIPAAVSYRLFVRTKDIKALEEAIRNENNAIDAWKSIVEAAGDVYADDLMMGVREAEFMNIKHHLSGHWKDELGYLNEGISKLEKERLEFKSDASVKESPEYKISVRSDNHTLFKITHNPVQTVESGKPLIVDVNVKTMKGVKRVNLRYRAVNQQQDYRSVEMEEIADKGSYQAIVPAEEINPRWDLMYYIEIFDTDGHGMIYPDLNIETPYIVVKLVR